MFGPPISQSAWIVSTRTSRSWYSGSILAKSFASTWSVKAIALLLWGLCTAAGRATCPTRRYSRLMRRRGARRLLCRAGAVRQVVLEIFREQSQRALDRRRGHADQAAEALAARELDHLVHRGQRGGV